MNTTATLLKILILLVLFSAAMIGIFSEPDDNSARWLSDFLLSKSIGAISIFIFSILYKRWGRPSLAAGPNESKAIKQCSDIQ